MVGMPIICFDQSTGISEVIQDQGGFIAAYSNTESVAKKIIEYKNNSEIHKRHSLFNQHVFEKYTVAEKAPEIFKLLEEILEPNLKPI